MIPVTLLPSNFAAVILVRLVRPIALSAAAMRHCSIDPVQCLANRHAVPTSAAVVYRTAQTIEINCLLHVFRRKRGDDFLKARIAT